MNCSQIEILLPAYLEADLSAEEMAGIQSHLAECASCREVLNGFTQLDGLLAERRLEVPPAHRTILAVLSRFGPGRAKQLLDALFSMPGIISQSFLITGIVLFVYRRYIENLLAGEFSIASFLVQLGMAINSILMNLTGGDVLALSGLYVGVLLFILLGTVGIVLKFVRDAR
jgi:hypothetical protein